MNAPDADRYKPVNKSSSPPKPASSGDERARIRQSFLLALVITPNLFVVESARRIVSPEATLLAVALGVTSGFGAAIGLADVDLGAVGSVTASVVALACIGLTTVAVWLVVPSPYLGTVIQFAVAFTWTMALTNVRYHRKRTHE